MSLQRDKLKQFIVGFCNGRESRTFSRQELLHELGDDYEAIVVGGETPEQTVSRLLQELRDIAFLTFTEDRGSQCGF
ncbi:MAG: hypothetical protein ACNYPG_06160 [Candidatus Porifericomitaceae bacterium WSBS_2022_MAG_OTU9]